MYSTNLHDQLINAALPLKPLTTWSGGACTVTVAVPPTQSTVGVSIDSVRVELSLPSGQTASAEAVNVEDTPNWVATFPADVFATSGFVAQGLTVYMGGTDEHSTERVWIVSKGDLEVKPGDASPSPTGSFVVVKLRDSAPSTPVEGDAYIGGGTLYIYHDGEWVAFATPTRTSQLTNDGDGSAENVTYVLSDDSRLTNARTPTAHHATHAANGSDPIAPSDIGAASASDLPYRLVEPGEWEFSDGGIHTVDGPVNDSGDWYWELDSDSSKYSQVFSSEQDALAALSLTFEYEGVTATRASLPGHLCDRAGHLVVVSGDTTLTLPAANPGYLRDFLVRLEISGSTVPTITFAAPTGETITYETDGDEFPVPDEAGTWSYSFTENCVAHTFAVSLKKDNEVAQGGS